MNRRSRAETPLAILIALSAFPVASGQACPAALLTGDLVRQGDELVVMNGNGASLPAERIRWPGGHRLEERDGRLVDVDLFGTVQAGEGDSVRLGGGETTGVDGTWGVCGLLEVDAAAP